MSGTQLHFPDIHRPATATATAAPAPIFDAPTDGQVPPTLSRERRKQGFVQRLQTEVNTPNQGEDAPLLEIPAKDDQQAHQRFPTGLAQQPGEKLLVPILSQQDLLAGLPPRENPDGQAKEDEEDETEMGRASVRSGASSQVTVDAAEVEEEEETSSEPEVERFNLPEGYVAPPKSLTPARPTNGEDRVRVTDPETGLHFTYLFFDDLTICLPKVPKTDRTSDSDKTHLKRFRGKGSYGYVVEGINVETGKLVAVKTLIHKKASYGTKPSSQEKSAKREAANARRLGVLIASTTHRSDKQSRNPNVVNTRYKTRLVYKLAHTDMEHTESFLLRNWEKEFMFIKEVENGEHVARPLKGYEIFFNLYLQNLQNIRTVHENNLLHRDIKPENSLLMRGGAELSDFGLTIERGSSTGIAGTAHYMAPESILFFMDEKMIKDLVSDFALPYILNRCDELRTAETNQVITDQQLEQLKERVTSVIKDFCTNRHILGSDFRLGYKKLIKNIFTNIPIEDDVDSEAEKTTLRGIYRQAISEATFLSPRNHSTTAVDMFAYGASLLYAFLSHYPKEMQESLLDEIRLNLLFRPSIDSFSRGETLLGSFRHTLEGILSMGPGDANGNPTSNTRYLALPREVKEAVLSLITNCLTPILSKSGKTSRTAKELYNQFVRTVGPRMPIFQSETFGDQLHRHMSQEVR